jgi:Fe-S cluster assembly protein SufD
VFQGKIIVRPKAQKTDAKMMTQALLLSENAEADNKPELEIFADDVQCGHGATTGALDEDLRFYLMARGIPKKQAEALLVQAFVGEAIEGIEHAGLRDALMGHVASWLSARD